MLKTLKTHRQYKDAEHKHNQLIIQEFIRVNKLLYSTLMHDLVKLFQDKIRKEQANVSE